MKKILYSLVLAIAIFSLGGCDLTEKNYSNIDRDIYYQNESSVKGAVAAIYARAAYGFCEYFYYLQEFSADQIAWRTWNGGQWGWDEGLKFVLSSQTWTSESKILLQAWESAWTTIGMCNQLITDLQALSASDLGITDEALLGYIAEVRTLRAWAYYNNFELWGGALPLCVSVSSEVPGSADADFNAGCKKVYDFIAGELDESLANLQNKGGNRVSPAMNRMLKMRLLLNAEIFIGENHYADCAQVAEELDQNREDYAKEIRDMQQCIRRVTDKSVKIQAQEARNKELMREKFATIHRQAKAVRKNSRAITGYYNSMKEW